MEGKRRWFGWIAIGLGALALLVALLGRGLGSQFAAAGPPGANAPQSYAQPGTRPQGGTGAPGVNTQPGVGPQGGMGAQGAGPQDSVAPQGRTGPQGAEARHRLGRPGDAGFGLGEWLRFPLRLLGGVSQMVMLALLVLFGVWLIRGRTMGGAPIGGRAEPAQGPPPAPLSPTGESYTEEPSEPE